MSRDDYNYARFDHYVDSGRESEEFSAFPDHLHAGEAAPDFAALRLDDGRSLRLSEVWSRRNVVLEFGSFT